MKDPKISKDIQLAYLWKWIIYLAFSPSGKEIFDWISCYSKSVTDFWEIDSYPKQDKYSLTVYNCNIPISFDFSLEKIDKFIVQFFYPHTEGQDFMWLHDVDKSHFVPEQPILTNDNHRNSYLKKITPEDVLKVLNGLFFHPSAHQHIEGPINHHIIRIGGGIHNPFQFLFHLRYQLCLIEQKREDEKNRLTELFYNAIMKKCRIIAPGVLLNLN